MKKIILVALFAAGFCAARAPTPVKTEYGLVHAIPTRCSLPSF